MISLAFIFLINLAQAEAKVERKLAPVGILSPKLIPATQVQPNQDELEARMNQISRFEQDEKKNREKEHYKRDRKFFEESGRLDNDVFNRKMKCLSLGCGGTQSAYPANQIHNCSQCY